MDLELLQEAERRGLLPPDKKALLDEARRRGLLEAQLPDKPAPTTANPQAVDEFQERLGAVYDGAMQGGTFRFGDEIAGARAAVLGQELQPDGSFSSLDYSRPMSERYSDMRDSVRAQNEESQAAHPGMYGAGEMTGAAVQGMMTAPLAVGKSALGTIFRGGALGGLEGLLYGGGEGETGGERLANALSYGGIGLGAGMAVPVGIMGARSGLRALRGGLDAVTGAANTGKAQRAIADALNASGQSADDVSRAVAVAAREGQPEYRLMDALGVAGRRKASGITRSGGDAATELAQFLEQRQLGQSERVSSFVDEAFNMGGETAEKARTAMRAARRKVADEAYTRAAETAKPVDVLPVVAALDDTISQMTNSGIKPPKVVKEFQKLRAQLAGKTRAGEPTTLSDYESVLTIWRQVRDQVDEAFTRGGSGASVGEALKPIRDGLEQALADSSDGFRMATAKYRADSEAINAIDAGADMARNARRSADTSAEFAAMKPREKISARRGYGDRVLAQLEANPAPTANKAKPLQSPKRTAEAQAMTTDPDLYLRRLQRESDMWEAQNRALGGSKTADNLQDISTANAEAGGLRSAIRKAMNFQFGDAAADVGAVLGNMARGETEKTRMLIAKALMSGDPAEFAAKALTADQQRKLLDALLAASMRPGAQEGGRAIFGN